MNAPAPAITITLGHRMVSEKTGTEWVLVKAISAPREKMTGRYFMRPHYSTWCGPVPGKGSYYFQEGDMAPSAEVQEAVAAYRAAGYVVEVI